MRFVATLVVALALLVPASALAGNSTCQAYNAQTCNVGGVSQSRSDGSDGGATSSVNSGTLPFTGLDVVLLVVGGGALLGAGFVVRRLSRRLN
jgi:hypothetical protein